MAQQLTQVHMQPIQTGDSRSANQLSKKKTETGATAVNAACAVYTHVQNSNDKTQIKINIKIQN